MEEKNSSTYYHDKYAKLKELLTAFGNDEATKLLIEYDDKYVELRSLFFIRELLELNPLLENKSPEELVQLLETIDKCGYKWDESKKHFYNKEINNAIRTQGLDLFNAKKFKEKHEFWKKRNTTPEYVEFMYLMAKIKKVLLFIILYGLLGWIIIPFKIWIISLTMIVVLYLAFDVIILGRKRKRRDEALKNIK